MARGNMISLPLIAVAVSALLTGCGSAQKTIPHMGFGNFDVRTELAREDVVVLDTVEGSSTSTSIAFGIINIIDGEKLQLLGVKFFKDKYTYFKESDTWWATVADRAYYKALEATPEADTVFVKSMDHEDGGVPLLWETKAVTFRGKAIKLKADQ